MYMYCVRQGQVEVGVVEHEGREFAALGATVVGRHVTGYTRRTNDDIMLTTWCGQTMLDCRCEVVERHWTGSLAIMFRLPHGRYVVGYALADHGMLFQGELVTNCEEEEARAAARRLAERLLPRI